MTYANSISQRAFRAAAYALTRQPRMLRLELLLLEIDRVLQGLAGVTVARPRDVHEAEGAS
jgi:hypothetical protein